ncbi:MAG: SsrA-binding protein SmpB [Planctomycetota bacterium]|nr:MAG: SsrA-binding protein SmpB [Planctomycetota bacterium]
MPAPERPTRDVAQNRKARRNFEILDRLEAGVVLQGTEVKTLRAGQASIEEAYIKARADGLWLVNAHIAEYERGNVFNHEPDQERRLLVHKREWQRLRQRVREKGLTLVPLRLYFRGKWAKIELGLARGRQLHDKRAAIRDREAARALQGARGRRP